ANVSFSVTTVGSAGAPVTLSGSIIVTTGGTTNSDVIHDFTASGKTSTFFTITGNLSTGYGTASYAGLTLTQCLKMESSTNIAFTTTAPGTLTLVFGSTYTGAVSVDGTSYTPVSGIVTVSLAAGAHTIKKIGTNYLFYMSVVYSTSGIENTKVSKVFLYPNPVINSLSVSSNEGIEKVEVYSLAGVLVKRVEADVKTIDMSNLSSGSYLVKVYSNQGVDNELIIKK
ncbi:MAG: T9SS type A sorting domain-containing protein, partial [Paludibacter sp.]